MIAMTRRPERGLMLVIRLHAEDIPMSFTSFRNTARVAGCAASITLLAVASAAAQAPAKAYPAMARISAYFAADSNAEIALARTAAPASIARSADILVFGSRGYHRAVSGDNGFTCLVERSWNDAFDNPEFWNPSIRVPICFNAAATRSILPVYLARTAAVLVTHTLSAVRAAAQRDTVPDPAPRSMAMMMSRHGYLADGVGAAGPHVMVFLPNTADSAWGANLAGSPIGATPGDKPSITIFYLPVRQWSDGTPIVPAAAHD
jgi:hypothetical protein